MATSSRSIDRIRPRAPHPSGVLEAPDPSWKGLYGAGGVSAFLYILLALIVPALMMLTVDGFWVLIIDGPALLEFIAAHKGWWIVLQTLVLESSILAVVVFAALFVALKHVSKSYAAIGTIVSATAHLLFMAYYPVLLGLVYLSEQYAAATAARQGALATAAEALIAQNSAFNPFYEALMGVGILILSLVMLGGVFPKGVAYLGIATCAAAFIGLALWPVLGVAYFWWWLLFVVWFALVGWKLYRLGRPERAK